ncbi:GMC family oxidoreductase, partial [[Ruminococcus] torques]|uniref:GMC oxidoreductase n=1 Tax=[Ruminococcus] torques TaxID=33039 RepID=UPI001EDD2F31
SHGTHQIGTARMAATAATGVVDRDLCCFGAKNLHVASAAVLPTSGQANPTLTVMALGMRLVDRLAAGRSAIVETGSQPASPALAL